MRFSIFLVFSLVSVIASSQNFKVIVKSADNQSALSDVLFYSKNQLLGKTNKNGEVFLGLKFVDTIQIVKEDFTDLSILKDSLGAVIFLEKLKFFVLDEVIVSKLNDQEILNKVESRLINPIGFYSNARAIQYYNILTVNQDTLHYLNNRMKFKPYDGNYINLQNKIIKKFYFDNNYLIYKIDNKKITFREDLSTYWPFIGRKDGFLEVLKNKEDYNFELVVTDDFFKILFKAKKNKKFTYEGYLIVDKLDFGIYELEMKLVANSANIRDTYLLSEKQNISYLINDFSVFYTMSKVNNEYIIKSANYNFIATNIKGDFKGAEFINKVRVETTPDFIDEEMYKFNFLRYE